MADLEKEVMSEPVVAEVLGVDAKKLGYLRRERGLPAVMLTRQTRVYLTDSVLQYLKDREKAQLGELPEHE